MTANLAGGGTRGGGNAASPPRATGPVHSAEIEYAMGNLPLNKVFAWTPDDYKVSATMQGFFENFIKTGDPNDAGLPRWPVGTVGAGVRCSACGSTSSRAPSPSRGRATRSSIRSR